MDKFLLFTRRLFRSALWTVFAFMSLFWFNHTGRNADDAAVYVACCIGFLLLTAKHDV